MLVMTPLRSPLRARMTKVALAFRVWMGGFCSTYRSSGTPSWYGGCGFEPENCSVMWERDVARPYSSWEKLRMKCRLIYVSFENRGRGHGMV